MVMLLIQGPYFENHWTQKEPLLCHYIDWKYLVKGNDKPRQHIKKQRHYFAYKGLSSQSYGFSSNHVLIWELDYKERLSAEELILLNCGIGEDSWESLGLQGYQISQS